MTQLVRTSVRKTGVRDRMEKHAGWHELRDGAILSLLWFIATGIDQLWLAVDRSIPSWDPADHLIGALNYWWTLQPQNWGTGELWHSIWTLSSKYPPLLYISTAPFLSALGRGADQAMLVNLVYTGILLLSVYGLGRVLFRPEVGLWAAGLCLLFPQFYSLRTSYYMDYPLATLVTASVLTLTVWAKSIDPPNLKRPFVRRSLQWLLALGLGVTLGLAFLMKQTALFFLAIPLLWVAASTVYRVLRYRQWHRLGQLLTSLLIAGLMILPWGRTNWVFQISAVFSSNTRSAQIEGDPAWNTLEGWLYYWQQLPAAISYPLLIVPIVGLLIALMRWSLSLRATSTSKTTPSTTQPSTPNDQTRSSTPVSPSLSSTELPSFLWLGLCLLSTYAIWSAIANKDSRYIMPWLPFWSILLAYGLLSFPKKWGQVKWITVGLATVIMAMNLFPLGGGVGRAIANTIAPGAYHQPYLGGAWPHDEVIEEIITTQPHQIANIGILPSTPEINQHNFTYVGNRRDFQVYARRMGKSKAYLERDVRSLSWFMSVSPPNVNHHSPKSRRRQKEVVELIKDSRDFKRHRIWDLPDGSRLRLFKRRSLPVEVEPLDNPIANVLYGDPEKRNRVFALLNMAQSNSSPNSGGSAPDIQPMKVQLENVTVPQRATPGTPVPVTYEWSGSWSMLHDGLVFLTWQRTGPIATPQEPNEAPVIRLISTTRAEIAQESDVSEPNSESSSDTLNPNQYWFHDHNIGMGTLYPQRIQANQTTLAPSSVDPLKPFTVTERTAMLPPETTRPGRYTLEATYLNSVTGESYPLEVPEVTLRVRRNAQPSRDPEQVPELDFVTQFRQAARHLPEGIDGLNQVFDDVSRINLYDPVQAYTAHTEDILTQRLVQNPENLDDAYGLALAHVLQRDAPGAIAALEQVTELDPENAHAHAELAFVNLYDWRPWAAQKALDRAIALDPDVPEFKTLNTVTALMRGNLFQAWKRHTESQSTSDPQGEQ